VFGSNTLFCNWNFRTPAWVNNVIGMHESCLGQLPWDRFTGRVPFTEGFLSSGYQLGFSALLISLEFFPHTCNNSSKVVNDVLVGLCFGNYYREIIVNDHARHHRKFHGIPLSLSQFFLIN
jgi:hypothetical protein